MGLFNTTKASDNKKFKKNLIRFGGKNSKQIKEYLNQIETGTADNIRAPMISTAAQNSLNTNSADKEIVIPDNASFETEVAILFSEGQVEKAITKLREHLNTKKLDAEQSVWLLLLEAYQHEDRADQFNNIATRYYRIFNESPPNFKQTKNIESGWDNVLILPDILTIENCKKFRPFFQASRKEKQCKINFSKCNFLESEEKAILNLFHLLQELRAEKIVGNLIGEQALIDYCLDSVEKRGQNAIGEENSWLLYLEILIWTNKIQLFEQKSLQYATLFSVSPPYIDEDWLELQQENLQKNNPINKDLEEDDVVVMKEVNRNNFQLFIDFLKEAKVKNGISSIDFTEIDMVSFSVLADLYIFLEQNQDTKYFFVNINRFTLLVLQHFEIDKLIKYQLRK